MVSIKNIFTLLALLSGVGGAWLSFKRSFFNEFKEQMLDLKNETGISSKAIRFSYKCLGRIFLGRKENWITLFDPVSEKSKIVSKDKNISLRIFGWFSLTFIFSFISWFVNLEK